MEYNFFFLLGLLTICSCTSIPAVPLPVEVKLPEPTNDMRMVPQKGPALGLTLIPKVPLPLEPSPDKNPVAENNKVPEVPKTVGVDISTSQTSPEVKEEPFIKLYVQNQIAGIYRTEQGEYVRIFKVINADFGPSFLIQNVPREEPRPTLQRLTPSPFLPQVPLPVQGSLARIKPSSTIMARSGNGKIGPTGRYSFIDSFGSYDNYNYNPTGYYGSYNGYGNGYGYPNFPYNSYDYYGSPYYN